MQDTTVELEPLKRLTKDIKSAAATLSDDEARYLVDTYYQMQDNRIRADGQIRAMNAASEQSEPHLTLDWLSANAATLERNIKSALDAYSDSHMVGRWSKGIVGIGPVLAAGLLANIDLMPWKCNGDKSTRKKADVCNSQLPCTPRCCFQQIETVGHIWRFAGLDPTVSWQKGQKRPWNASLKTLQWKIGESFVKVSGHKDDVYGHLYLERKQKEIARNDAGELAEQAVAKLAKFRIGKNTEAYKHYEAGRLPPSHIHARAKRWAVKLFLSHWHAVAYRDRFGVDAPKPYILTQPHHTHDVRCPNWPF